MKKILTAVLFVLLVCAASASLAQKGESKSFQFLACCTEAKTIQWDADNYLEKDQNDHKIYVRHWVSGGSDEYTNLFQARDVQDTATCPCNNLSSTLNTSIIFYPPFINHHRLIIHHYNL